MDGQEKSPVPEEKPKQDQNSFGYPVELWKLLSEAQRTMIIQMQRLQNDSQNVGEQLQKMISRYIRRK